MFTSVQPLQSKPILKGKKGTLIAGMPFANWERMIKKFTYKELTLIVGIIVALVIVFAVWSNQHAGGISFAPSLEPQLETHSLTGLAKQAVSQVLAITFR